MNTELQNLLDEFLQRNIPTEVLNAYRIVTQLTYPIDDKYSLSVQLDERAKQPKAPEDKDLFALELVRFSFDVTDFPIMSIRGGLEKFHHKQTGRSAFNLPGNFELPFRADPSDPGKGPEFDAAAFYRMQLSGDECAVSCALAHYNWFRDSETRYIPPVREFYARPYGLAIGHECQRTGFCPAFPSPGRRPGVPLFYCPPSFTLPPPFPPSPPPGPPVS